MKTAMIYLGKAPGFILGILIVVCFLIISGCKKEDENFIIPQPPPPVDTTSYTLIFKDAGIPVQDTIYKKLNELFNYSWWYKGGKGFEILLDGQHLSYDTVGQGSLLIDNPHVFNFKVGGEKVRSQVVIAIKEIPPPVITVICDTNVAYNGSTNFSWDIQYSTLVLLNGSPIDYIGTIQFTSLKKDTTLLITASNTNGTLVSTKRTTIHVDPKPAMTRFEIITQPQGFHPIVKYREFPNGYKDTLTDFPEKNLLYKFGINMRLKMYNISGGNKVGDMPWGLLENETQILEGDNLFLNIDSITEKNMFLTGITPENCWGCYNGETFFATYDYELYTPPLR